MKVLFIGNSHTYFNDMPRTFADMCERGLCATQEGDVSEISEGGTEAGKCDHETGERVDVTMLAYSWKDLEWHASTEYFTVRFNILYGEYDYCVIQQGAHPFPGDETTLVNAQRICELCEKVGTRPILIETWAERDYPEHQENLSRANRMVAEKCGAMLAPVGTVWEKIRADHPEINLFWKDGEHAGVYGDLIIASVLYRLIGKEENWFISNSDDLNRAKIDFDKNDTENSSDMIDTDGEVMCAECSARSLDELCGDDDFMLRDFASDIKIDFHHPRVLENVDEIMITPDREIVKIICEYVNEVVLAE